VRPGLAGKDSDAFRALGSTVVAFRCTRSTKKEKKNKAPVSERLPLVLL